MAASMAVMRCTALRRARPAIAKARQQAGRSTTSAPRQRAAVSGTRRTAAAAEEGAVLSSSARPELSVDVVGGDPSRAGLCGGCGARLQTAHVRQPGYVPPVRPVPARHQLAPVAAFTDDDWQAAALFNTGTPVPAPARATSPTVPAPPVAADDAVETTVCQRCHSLTHYGRVQALDIAPALFRQQLLQLRARAVLLVLVVDVFDLPGSVLPDVDRLMGADSDVILVGHKVDLLPKDARRDRVRQWLARQVRPRLPENGPLAIHLASAQSGEGVAELLDLIQRKRGDRDVYLVGCANVGKSRLINALLDRMGAKVRTRATTSFLPGTTLATVRFPLAGGGFLADSPGVLAADQLATRLTPHELQLVQPQKVLRPVTYLLSPGRSLMLGGLGRLDVLQASSRLLATVCVGFRLPVHVTQTDRVPSLLERHWGRALLQPPVLVADADDNASVERPGHGDSGVEAPWFRGPDRMATLLPRDTDAVAVDIRPGEDTVLRRDVQAWPEASHGLSVKEANRDLAAPDRVTPSLVDVVFPGLGWIALTVTPDASATLRAVTCPGLRITLREPLLPFEVQKRGSRERGDTRSRYY